MRAISGCCIGSSGNTFHPPLTRVSPNRCGKIQPTKSMLGNIAPIKNKNVVQSNLFQIIMRFKKIVQRMYFRASWDSRINMSQFSEPVSEIFFSKNDLKTFNLKKLLNHTNLQTIRFRTQVVQATP